MKLTALSQACLPLLLFTLSVNATTLYVDVNSLSSSAPYTNWGIAAASIQDAVDAASVGDLVLVTNGIYQTGTRVAGDMSNRVAVTKPVTVQSVKGPAVTSIVGYQVPGTANGDAAVRCVYLTNGAALVGFTVTNGATQGDLGSQRNGGGVWCASPSALVSNCVVVGNTASLSAGGVYSGTLNDCTLMNNSVVSIFLDYTAGGGANSATLNNCTLSANSAAWAGGGAYGGRLNNCKLSGNSVGYYGGGASAATLNNCELTGNSATMYGGGADSSTLNNCTLAGNRAGLNGGGAMGSTLNNCIVYYNLAPDGNTDGCTLNFCCTTPVPSGGTNNLSAEPQMASTSHLSSASPCRGAGSPTYVTGTDIDGEPWANPPSIGCDEYQSGSVTGALSATISLSWTNVSVGFSVDLEAVIDGRVSASSWDFGDGVVLSNRPWASHAWSSSGNFPVVLRAYNETYPEGVAASVEVHVVKQPVHHVSLSSTSPIPPFNSWQTAATNIQDALDATTVSGALVWVSNGVYQAGGRVVYGRVTNRVAVTKPVVLRSVNGPSVTSIDGGGHLRCAYLTNGATLAGFTFSNGVCWGSFVLAKEGYGGGVLCESGSAVVSNCVLVDNIAGEEGGGAYFGTLLNCTLRDNLAGAGGGADSCILGNCMVTGNAAGSEGGGAYNCTLDNCILNGNSATDDVGAEGGGACQSTLHNCVLTGNSANWAGAAIYANLNNCNLVGNSEWRSGAGVVAEATLNNCILYYNDTSAPQSWGDNITLNYCCTTPLPSGGTGNFTNAPLFVDLPGGDFHLRADSPCINAGLNTYVAGPTDLDGNPRIDGGTVDIGAYEFQGLAAFLAWLGYYGLPTDGSADYLDTDNDGMNNYQEWRAGTDPTNATSALRLQAPVINSPGLLLRWSSDTNHTYFVQRAASLQLPLSFSLVQSNIIGLPGVTFYMDATASPLKRAAYYRVGTSSTNGPVPALLQQPAFVPGSVTLTWSSVATRSYSVERATNLTGWPNFSLLCNHIPGEADTTSFTDTNTESGALRLYRVLVEE